MEMRLRQRLVLGMASLLIATSVWMPLVHLFFRPASNPLRSENGITVAGHQLAQRHVDLWNGSPEGRADIERMRVTNPEWDFMGRTYLVLSLGDMCLREPTKRQEYLAMMDRIIADTQAVVEREGVMHFLMAYAKTGEFQQKPLRSIFVDGEVALMLGARRLIEENADCRDQMRELVDITARRMSQAPMLSCESYPDECWTFCNTVALAAIRISDVLDGQDHSTLLQGWVSNAKQSLIDEKTGLLCSSYSYNGTILDGPEGSSIWMAAHCLQLIDESFAEDQYQRARKELRHECLGFGWAGEWPKSWQGPMDVDSGPVIPVIDVSAGSSGLAILGSAAFKDQLYYDELMTTLWFAAFPVLKQDRLQFCASNQVGDAVLLYSAMVGPLWAHVNDRAKTGGGR